MEGPLLAALLLPESAVAEVDADVGDLAVDGLAVVVEGGRLQDDAGGADEDGQRVVRDGEPDDKLDVLEGWLGTQQINKSTPAVPSVESEKLDFISYPWLSGNQVRETAGRTSCQTN